MGFLDQGIGADRQRLGQGFVKRQRRITAIHPAVILGPQMAGIMARQQRKHGLPFIRHPPAEHRGHRRLAVEIDHQHLVAIQRRRHRQMRRRRGLADPALEVGHRHHLGRQADRAVGQVFLGL